MAAVYEGKKGRRQVAGIVHLQVLGMRHAVILFQSMIHDNFVEK